MALNVTDTIEDSTTWREAAQALVHALIEEGSCFSSGELAAHIRTHRSDMAFSVMGLGEFVRDLFYGGDMPDYVDDDEVPSPVLQVSRTTVGTFRTPPGLQVFVYCQDDASGLAHRFEVDIPLPPGVSAPDPDDDDDDAPSVLPNVRTPDAHKPVLKATVHIDCRVCIPRSAFEAYVHESGKVISGGAEIYLSFDDEKDPGEAKISLDKDISIQTKTYHLHASRGRILFAAPGSKPFTPRRTCEISIEKDQLVVDLKSAY